LRIRLAIAIAVPAAAAIDWLCWSWPRRAIDAESPEFTAAVQGDLTNRHF
jgi:hypothetical protein